MTASRTGSAPRADGLAAQAAASAAPERTRRVIRFRIASAPRLPSFERRLRRRHRFLGGGFGRGAKPPSEELIRKLAPLPLLLGPALAAPSDLVNVPDELDRVPLRVQEVNGIVGPRPAVSDRSQA